GEIAHLVEHILQSQQGAYSLAQRIFVTNHRSIRKKSKRKMEKLTTSTPLSYERGGNTYKPVSLKYFKADSD
ncbi:MAG: hypothetical protein ABIT70_14860, partial [Sulfuriferula sp.]